MTRKRRSAQDPNTRTINFSPIQERPASRRVPTMADSQSGKQGEHTPSFCSVDSAYPFPLVILPGASPASLRRLSVAADAAERGEDPRRLVASRFLFPSFCARGRRFGASAWPSVRSAMEPVVSCPRDYCFMFPYHRRHSHAWCRPWPKPVAQCLIDFTDWRACLPFRSATC